MNILKQKIMLQSRRAIEEYIKEKYIVSDNEKNTWRERNGIVKYRT